MRHADVRISEAELAHLCVIVEHYRVGSPVPRLDRHVASVVAKRFLTRAAKAMPLSEAEQEESRPRLKAAS